MTDDPFSREIPAPSSEFATDRPQLTLGAMTYEDFRNSPVEERALVYAGIGAGLADDPANMPDEFILLYSYGMNRDGEARDYADGVAELAPFFSNFTGDPGYQLLLNKIAEEDPAAADLMMQYDAVEGEALQLPVTTIALVLAAKGAIASATFGPAITVPTGGLSTGGFTGGSVASTAAALKGGVLRIAAWATGSSPTAFVAKYVAVGGGGVVIASGAPSDAASMLDNYFNSEDVQEQEDIQNGIALAQQGYAMDTQGGPGAPPPLPPGVSPFVPPTPGDTFTTAGDIERQRALIEEHPNVAAPLDEKFEDVLTQDDLDMLLSAEEERVAGYSDDPLIRTPYDVDPATPGRQPWQPQGVIEGGKYGNVTSDYIRDVYNTEYRESDIQETLNNLSVGQLARLQDLAVRAGLINPDSTAFPPYSAGTRDFRTEAALGVFMGQANFDGRRDFWKSAGEMAIAGDKAAAEDKAEAIANRPGYTRRPYFKPDLESINELVDQSAERKLGRKINDWERVLLHQEYLGAHRQNYEAEEAAGASFFRAQYRAQDTHSDTGAGSFQAVDPEARFAQRFRDVFEDELDRRDRTERVASMTGNLMQGLRNAEAAVSR